MGRKGRWSNAALDDFIDIVAHNKTYKEKLIFRNTKNQQNGIMDEKLQNKLKECCEEGGRGVLFHHWAIEVNI